MRKLIPVFALVLLLASCTMVSPFSEERPYVSNIGKNGDYVFTTTRNVLGIEKIDIKRISGCYHPETSLIYGAVEGNFSKAIFNSAMSFSKNVQKVKQGSIKVWFDKQNQMYYYCPVKGIVLFANDDIESVYLHTFIETKQFADSQSIVKMLGAEIGFYIKKPSVIPEIGFNISASNVERFERICAGINGEIMDVDFVLSTKDFSDAFFKLIKASVIGKLILNGEKPDLQALKEQISQDGNTVSLNSLALTYDEQQNVINTIIKDI